MRYHRELLMQRIDQGEDLQYILFWEHTEKPDKVTKACLSQWYPCHFEVDGISYCCTEQYMMAQKALLFGDQTVYEKIMASSQPKEIKALGREITGFEQAKWDDQKYPIVLKGNIAKFSQNQSLKDFLLETGDAVLAEASPYDGIWGIRLPMDHPLAKDPASWQGENLLGFVLMEARDILQESEQK